MSELFGVEISRVRAAFNRIPYTHRTRTEFDQHIDFANAGKHGSYHFLKRLAKEVKNVIQNSPAIPR